jgi:hypothetical protein
MKFVFSRNLKSFLADIAYGCLTLIHFYLPHMEYEGSIGLVTRKMKKKADFHVLGFFMAKKHDFNEKIFSVCHAPSDWRLIFEYNSCNIWLVPGPLYSPGPVQLYPLYPP